jgi:VIT1/CCC1 family predicted Fe2+/Mn2+ transporter
MWELSFHQIYKFLSIFLMMRKRSETYLGSVVLGLNDALVEVSGTLAGLTLALQNSKIILISVFITGLAASSSMAGSEYLSTKAECHHTKREMKMKNHKNAGTSAFYTGIAYFLTVLFLLFPYLILTNIYHALFWALLGVVVIITLFSYYSSIKNEENFFSKFIEMSTISLSVATISFIAGYLIKIFFNIEKI